MRHGNDSRGNGCIIGIADYIGDKGAVDLQGVDREALEIAEGGIAAAEIIDRNLYLDSAELDQRPDRQVDVLHGSLLSDLDLQAMGGEAGFHQGGFDELWEVFFHELAAEMFTAMRKS